MSLFMPKKPKIYMLISRDPFFKIISINHRGMYSLINSCYCDQFSVKFMVIQLKLNGTDYKLIFYIYSNCASNT
jgi:hypothetical protein